jgi:hypothetical protein
MSDPQWEESGRREGLDDDELTGETGDDPVPPDEDDEDEPDQAA